MLKFSLEIVWFAESNLVVPCSLRIWNKAQWWSLLRSQGPFYPVLCNLVGHLVNLIKSVLFILILSWVYPVSCFPTWTFPMAAGLLGIVHSLVCVTVGHPGTCFVLLAILCVSAVPPLDGAVKIGRRETFLMLDLFMPFLSGICCWISGREDRGTGTVV